MILGIVDVGVVIHTIQKHRIAYKSIKPHNSWGFLYKIEMRHLMICLQNVRYLGDSYIKEFILRASRGILVSRF